MADYQVKPETKRSQDLMAVLDQKREELVVLVAKLNSYKVESENNIRKMEKEISKQEANIVQVRTTLRAELSKVDAQIFIQDADVKDAERKSGGKPAIAS